MTMPKRFSYVSLHTIPHYSSRRNPARYHNTQTPIGVWIRNCVNPEKLVAPTLPAFLGRCIFSRF